MVIRKSFKPYKDIGGPDYASISLISVLTDERDVGMKPEGDDVVEGHGEAEVVVIVMVNYKRRREVVESDSERSEENQYMDNADEEIDQPRSQRESDDEEPSDYEAAQTNVEDDTNRSLMEYEGYQKAKEKPMEPPLELGIPLRPLLSHPEKVPETLRNVNKSSYTPRVVSIGPFHPKEKGLKGVEMHKVSYICYLFRHLSSPPEETMKAVRNLVQLWESDHT
uniref:Protein LEO1 homolog isoform X1 n=1 Tax=Tanacetum cinerariifolium TaxID=118510 RepID=A0A6L2M2Z9_TANCI|nr:protein LEO1 homolog isoform X1 [Tanacetum cinerariifolium]